MKAVKIKKDGGTEVLELQDITLRKPVKNEVIIEHVAIGLNYIDTYHRSGLYPLIYPSGLGMEASGLDISEETRKLLNEDEIDLSVCDVESETGLPFSDNYFDVIYSKSFLEHLNNPGAFLEEANRVLKPGGLFLCLVPDWESQYKIFYDDVTHKTPFTKVALSQILKINNFEKTKVYKFRQLPIVWKYPVLNYFCAAISPFIPVRVENKFLRWSRELMLIGSAYKSTQKDPL